MKYDKIAIIASDNLEAIKQKKAFIQEYEFLDLEKIKLKKNAVDLIIALGGDGLMLHLLHEYKNLEVPIYGINFGTIGFLMNSISKNLHKALSNAKEYELHPLKMIVTDVNRKKHDHLAINEVSLLRQTNQTSKIQITVNNKVRMKSLDGDGVLVATSAGSTAYNLSVRGPIIPFGAKMIAMTPISPFRPRNWHGALLPSDTRIKFTILDHQKRPVSASADYNEIRDVKEVEIFEDKAKTFKILFDPNHSLEERIIKEQFL